MTSRREWLAALAVSILGVGCDPRPSARNRSRGYAHVSPPQPIPNGSKIDVIDFFRYSCPHCHSFEPMLEAWIKQLPAGAVLRRVPFGVGLINEVHCRLFYALQAMNQLDTLHRRVFEAFHTQNRKLADEPSIAAFVRENGIDSTRFIELFRSPAVEAQARRADQICNDWKAMSVPSLGIQGRYFISMAIATSPERMLTVASELIEREAKGLKPG